MGGPIGPHQSRTVNHKAHGQLLNGHIMDHLIIGPLQKGGIQGNKGPHPLARQSGGKGHRVLFRNAHIKTPIRKGLGQHIQSRPTGHGGGDAHNAGILFRQGNQGFSKNRGITGRGRLGGGRLTRGDIKTGDAVEFIGRGLSRGITFPFLGDHVQQDRPINHTVTDVGQQGNQGVQPVPIHGADIIKPQLFKQRAAHHQTAGEFLSPFGRHHNGFGQFFPKALHNLPQRAIGF